MAWIEQKQDFTGLSVYSAQIVAGAVFPSPAIVTDRCLGVFYFSGGLRLMGPDGDIPCGAVDVFTRWAAYGIDVTCEAGPDGAEWLCFSCDNPQGKNAEQVDIDGSYILSAHTQAIVVKGEFNVDGEIYPAISEMLFANDMVIAGSGTVILLT
jgi:hypothetical protein